MITIGFDLKIILLDILLMPKNQLFKIIPEGNIVQSILSAFGLENLEDTRFFTKEHMKDIETVHKMNELKDSLREYYIPCKGKVYLENIDEKKCITIMRQFIKYHNYKCIGMEKSNKGKKQMTYRLIFNSNDYLKSPLANKKPKEYVVSFE